METEKLSDVSVHIERTLISLLERNQWYVYKNQGNEKPRQLSTQRGENRQKKGNNNSNNNNVLRSSENNAYIVIASLTYIT